MGKKRAHAISSVSARQEEKGESAIRGQGGEGGKKTGRKKKLLESSEKTPKIYFFVRGERRETFRGRGAEKKFLEL